MEIKIEKATLNDIKQLSLLFELYRAFYRQTSNLAEAKIFLRNRISKKESIIFLAKNEEEIVGFTQLYPIFSSTKMKRVWLLNDLFVLKKYRGLGISKRLISTAKYLAIESKAEGILLETEKTNIPGNQLYPKTGFHLENETNFYFWINKEES